MSVFLTSDLRDIFARALLIRRTEEALLRLFRKGKVKGTVHTCIGQELTGLAVARLLGDHDQIISNHRCHGHYLSRFDDVRGLLAELMGRGEGICGGHGGSQHLYRPGFMSSGVQGGMAAAAVGLAWCRRQASTGGLVAYYIGDGTLGEGLLYESFNLASLLQVPLLYVLEDNGYAQSTAQAETLAGSIDARPAAFGIETQVGSTREPTALLEIGRECVDRVRKNQRPLFLRIRTWRLAPHSKGDDFRDPEELAAAWQGDPLAQLLAAGELATEDQRVEAELARLIQELGAGPVAALRAPDRPTRPPAPDVAPGFAPQVQRINQALAEFLAADRNHLFVGEDVADPYGGAFKVSQGLASRFPDQVRNMPISEAGIVGFGWGAAVGGRPCVVEIMFGDFVGLCFDQLVNHAAKVRGQFGQSVRVPLVVRTPMGGRRGYGATHSQCLEQHLAGIPELDLFVLHHRVEALGFYRALLGSRERCAVVCEHKLLYRAVADETAPPGYAVVAPADSFGVTELRPSGGADLTVLAYGYLGLLAEQAAARLRDEEVYLHVFLPVEASDPAVEGLAASLAATGKLLVLEEGCGPGGLGAAAIARLVAEGWPPGARVRHLTSPASPIPAAPGLEAKYYLDDQRLADLALEFFDEN